MVLLNLIKLFTIFSSYPISSGDVLKNITAVPIDHSVTDGGHFVNKIIHGQKLESIPDYLLFTAPYRLCGGECDGKNDNFAMMFPLFVGNKGKAKYRDMYLRDYKNLHQTASEAPFRVKTTQKPYTLCPKLKSTEETTTTAPVETKTEHLTLPTSAKNTKGSLCPKIHPGMCRLRDSNKVTFTAEKETIRNQANLRRNNFYLTGSKKYRRKQFTVADYLYDLY